MSNSVRPHRRQPTRLPRPWDSPGKNTGVGCHFLLQFMKVKSQSEVAQSGLTLSDPMDCSLPGFSIHGIFQARVLEWGAIAFSVGQHRLTYILYFYTILLYIALLSNYHLNFLHSSNKKIIFNCLWRQSYCLKIMTNLGEGNGTPLQYSCLENPMDRGAW